MPRRFEGKSVLVTGTSSGIGRATALAFAREGARVAALDQDSAGGEETVRLIEKAGGEGAHILCDVSKPAQIAEAVARAVKTFGKLDCAYNNAGVEGISAFTADCSEENWDRVIGINLKGLWLCMKAEIAAMLETGGGAVVNCASIAGLVGFEGLPAYVASKHGILGLTKTAALEYAKRGIRVNAVCPGVIKTPMVDRLTKHDPKAYADLLTGEPVARAGRPEEIAEAVLWLCSDAASFVTGHPLVADGGWIAR